MHFVDQVDLEAPDGRHVARVVQHLGLGVQARHLVVDHRNAHAIGAARNISVSHIVNGTTRLQQVESYIGQAAGIAGALSVKTSTMLRDISVPTIH